MACSQGVTPHLLKDLKLALDRTPIHRTTQRAKIVVHAHAFEFELSSVQEASLMGIESQCPDSENRFVAINRFSLHHNVGYRPVKLWCGRIPQHRILYAELLFEHL